MLEEGIRPMFCLILIVGGLLIMMGNTTALKRFCTTSGAGRSGS